MFKWLKARKTRQMALRDMDLSKPPISNLEIALADTVSHVMDSARLLHNSYLRRKIIQGTPGSMRLSLYSVLPSTALVVAKTGPIVVGTLQVHQRTETNLPIEETFDLSAIENGKIVEVGSLALHDLRSKNLAEVYFPMIGYVYQLCRRSIKADKIVIAVQPATAGFYEALFDFKVVPKTTVKKHRYAAHAEAVAMWVDLHKFPEFLKKTYRKLPSKWNVEDFLTVNSDIAKLFKFPTTPEPGIHPKPAIALEEIYVNRTPLLAQAPYEWRKSIAALYPDTDEYRWLFKVDIDVAGRSSRRYQVDEEAIITDSFGLARKGRLIDLSSGGIRVILLEKNVPPAIEEELLVELKPLGQEPMRLKGILRRADLSDYSLGIRLKDPPREYLEYVEDIRGTALGNSSITITNSSSMPTEKSAPKLGPTFANSTGSFMGRDD
jgi:hypothetical protein